MLFCLQHRRLRQHMQKSATARAPALRIQCVPLPLQERACSDYSVTATPGVRWAAA